MYQSLHHVAAGTPWSNEAVLAGVLRYAVTAMRQNGQLQATLNAALHEASANRLGA